MRLYAVSTLIQHSKTLKVELICSYAQALSKEEAIGLAYDKYSKEFNSSDGWFTPSVVAAEIPEEVRRA